MEKELRKLIKRLHSTGLHDDVARDIFKFGKPGYNYLWTVIDDPSLTDYQKKEFQELNIPFEQEILVKFLRQAVEMELHQTIRQQIEDVFKVNI